MQKNKMSFVIFLAFLSFYLIFNQYLPITDPVESNYALTAQEMVRSGNWLSPQIYGQFWYDKPIMIYWLIAGSFKLFGINDFAARLPMALFSALSVAALYRFVNDISGRRQALWSCIILGTSLEFWFLAKLVITDSVMFFFTSISLAWLYQGIIGHGRYYYYGAYVAAGLAVLTKGPVGLVLPGLTVFVFIALRRDWTLLRKLFLLPGLMICFCVAAPWYYLMYQQHGTDFITTFFGLHNYLRATVSEHPQDNVFYYYLILFPASLLPWTGLLFPAVWQAIKKVSRLHSYLLAWLITVVVFYTLMATKYPTYVFPAAFPAAVLMGSYVEKMIVMRSRYFGLAVTLPALILLLLLAATGSILSGDLVITVTQLICLGLACGLLFIHFKCSRVMLVTAVAVLTCFGSLVVIQADLLPLAHHRSATDIVRSLPPSGALVGMYGDYAASADYYSGYLIPKLAARTEVPTRSSVWSGKYTMPLATITDFLQQRQMGQQVFIIVKNAEEEKFMNLSVATGFRKVDERNELSLYELLP